MKLSDYQKLFTHLLPVLLDYAHVKGYEITLGDAYRDPRVFGNIGEDRGYGNTRSCHKLRLAIDLNLWGEGKYLTKTEEYKEIGEFWESIHPLCRWGGRFNDGNHFSIEYQGMK